MKVQTAEADNAIGNPSHKFSILLFKIARLSS